MKKNKTKGLFASIVLGVAVTACASASSSGTVTVVDRPDIQSVNTNYIGYRAPLRPLNFIKLPVGSIQPEGWVKKYLELQRDGLTGHLGEISAWLEKDNNAWKRYLRSDGSMRYGTTFPGRIQYFRAETEPIYPE